MKSNVERIRRHGGVAILVTALAVLAAGCGGRSEARVLGVVYERPAAVGAPEVAGAIVGVVTSGGQPVCITDRPAQAELRPVAVDLGAVVNASFSF